MEHGERPGQPQDLLGVRKVTWGHTLSCGGFGPNCIFEGEHPGKPYFYSLPWALEFEEFFLKTHRNPAPAHGHVNAGPPENHCPLEPRDLLLYSFHAKSEKEKSPRGR